MPIEKSREMNTEQLILIEKIRANKNEMEYLKAKLEMVEEEYHNNLLKLYDSVDILGKEKEIAKTEIVSMQEYKAKKLFRGKLIDKEDKE